MWISGKGERKRDGEGLQMDGVIGTVQVHPERILGEREYEDVKEGDGK